MNKWLKVGAVVALSLVGLVGSALGAGGALADRKMQRKVDVPVRDVALSGDADVLARGRYLFESRGCTECHGNNGVGRKFIDSDGMLARAPNITRGKHSAILNYGPKDWDRAVRHGVSPEGLALMIMPSEDYSRLTDADFAALTSYVVTLPAVDGAPRELVLPPVVKALYAFGAIEDAAEKIDHTQPPPAVVAAAPTKEYGAYVVNMCVGCHGPGLSGGKIPGGAPDWPAAANLTPGENSAMKRYGSLAAFKRMFRSGKRPDGTTINAVMPFGILKNMNDTDIAALYAHLQTLGPRADGTR